jgi:hypothetical protein
MNLGMRVMLTIGGVLSLALTGCSNVRTKGYLTQGPPRYLIFAPPQPEFVSLPPLPKYSDSQPPAPILAEMGQPQKASAVVQPPDGAREAVGAAPFPQVTGTANSQTNKVEFTLQSSGLITPEMLLRLFQGGRTAGFELPLTESVPFQMPTLIRPPSAASYDVK